MKYKRYPKYKDSGVEWIGEIPEEWEVRRLKYVFDIIKNGVWGTEPSQDNSNLICVRVADFNRNNSTVSLENKTLRNIPKEQEEKCLLVNGDLLLERSGGGEKQPVGFTVIYNHNVKAVCSNFITRLKPKNEFHSGFLNFLFSSMYYNTQNVKYIKQTTGIQNLELEYLSQSFFFPSYEEQTQISEVLDKQTTQFDELITKSKKQITLLEEKRQSMINQAVTKGLDPSVPMKDSGVEWIGEIPEGWEVKKLKFVTSCLDDKRIPLKADERNPGTFPYYGASGIVDYVDDYIFDERLVCFSEDGENLRSRQLPISFIIEGKVWVNNHAHVLKPINYNHGFLVYFLNSINITPFLEGSTRSKLNQSSMNNIPLPNPPLPEQQQIEDFLKKQTTQFDELITKSKKQITLLEEKRQALITAAVTGKIDVRGTVA